MKLVHILWHYSYVGYNYYSLALCMMSLFIYILLLTMLYKFMTHQSVIFITLKSLTTRTILFLLKAGVLTDGLVQMTLTPVGEIV